MQVFDLPYPKSESRMEVFISSLATGVAAYVFLLIFQPFGTSSFSDARLIRILLPYFLIVFSGFYLVNVTQLQRAGRWNFGREILKTVFIVGVCAVLAYFYNTWWVSKVSVSLINFFYMLAYTFSVAVPICSVYILARFIYLSRPGKKDQNLRETSVGPVSVGLEDDSKPIPEIRINDFAVAEHDLLFIESTDNYCTFYYHCNSGISSVLIRTTLKAVLEQVKSADIVRCHRSFIVNLQMVKSAGGNAQGYRLVLQDRNFTVPVSRKYMSELRRVLDN